MSNKPAIVGYIPETLDITTLEGYNKRWHDKYHWFIHSIVFKSLTSKDSFHHYVNLSNVILEKYIGANYLQDVKKFLVENEVIKCNKRFSVGAFSKSYKLEKNYINKPIKAVEIIKPTYKKKIQKIRDSYLKDVLNNNNIRTEFRNLTYARIDRERAFEYINANYKKGSKQYESRKVGIEQYDAMQYTEFSNGRYSINFTFKVHNGRIYSPATMLARDLERFTYFIGYENQDSVVLDMPNSQLCFYDNLTKTTKKGKFYGFGGVDSQAVNTNLKDIGSRCEGNERNNKENKKTVETKRQNFPISFVPPTLVPYVLYFDTNSLKPNAWQTLIFNSKGYEAMMCLSNYCDKNEGHTSEERQNFKEVFFGNLFYNKYQPKLTHLEEVFSKYFPNEFKALRSAKFKYGNKLLAVKVQSLEAKFFHKIAVNHLNRNYKHVPFVIKHDSIKVPIEYGFVIHDDLNKLAQSFFGRNDIKLKLETL